MNAMEHHASNVTRSMPCRVDWHPEKLVECCFLLLRHYDHKQSDDLMDASSNLYDSRHS